jgi:dTDP-4-dehydrorhamnose 3,5-epimerase
MPGVLLTRLKDIPLDGGNVLHGIKKNDPGYTGFGEAYFSTVEAGAIKAWKQHKEMTLNLVVPVGEIKFVLFDDREGASNQGQYFSINLSRKNYQRLTVPPLVWIGFQGIGKGINLLLNIADLSHNPMEVARQDQESFGYSWSQEVICGS